MADAIISPAGERLFRRGFAHKDAHVTATCIRLLDVLTGRANFGGVWAGSGTRKRPRAISDDDHHAPRAISDDAHQATEARVTSLVTAAIACGFSSAAGDAARWAAPLEAAVKLATTLLQQMSDEMAPLYKAVTCALPAKRVLACLGDATEYVAKACRDLVCVALAPHRARHAYSAQLQEVVLRWLIMPVHESPLREAASERDSSPGKRAGERTCELAATLGMGEALQEWLGEVEPRTALLAGLLERSLEAAMPDYAPTGSGCEHNGEVWSSQGCYHIWYPWLLESRVLLMYMRLLPLGLSSGAPPGLRERLQGKLFTVTVGGTSRPTSHAQYVASSSSQVISLLEALRNVSTSPAMPSPASAPRPFVRQTGTGMSAGHSPTPASPYMGGGHVAGGPLAGGLAGVSPHVAGMLPDAPLDLPSSMAAGGFGRSGRSASVL
jgi:hypothetical protein